MATTLSSPFVPRRQLIWLALLLLTAAIYGRSVGYGFVKYDDDALFSDRAIPRSVLGSEGKRLWMSSVFGNWQPVVTLTLVLDRRVHGLNPHWLHAEDAFLHGLCGIAVFEFLRRATRRDGASGWVAALFVCAPMHVESVAWLSERKDEMAALFFFLSLYAYCVYARSRGASAYAGSVAFAGLSLMCKPMASTVPAVLLLLDFWPLERLATDRVENPLAPSPGTPGEGWGEGESNVERAATKRNRPHPNPLPGYRERGQESRTQFAPVAGRGSWPRLLLEKIPFGVASVASAVIAVVTQRGWGQAAGLTAPLPAVARIDNAIVCYVLYAWKLAAPMNLAAFYPHPGSRPAGQVLAALTLLAAITAWAAGSVRRRPYRLVGWLWFLGTLVPVIGLFQIGAQAMADRYSYIPSVGLFVIGVWGVDELLGSRRAAGVGLVLVAAYSVLAFMQAGYWSDTATLFTHAAEVTTDNWEADAALGDVAFDRGDRATAAGYYSEVIRIAPGSPKGYERLAKCVAESDPARAATLLRSAVERSPLSVSYRLRLARALLDVGDVQSALTEARAAMALDPSSGAARAAVADLTRRSGH